MAMRKDTIGRANTVVVFGEREAARAVVASVVARIIRTTRRKRITPRGTGAFDLTVCRHLETSVLPVVDRIQAQVGFRQQSFGLSCVNLGAASARGVGVDIAGFSADAACLLSMLSAALELPLRQDVVATGHVASPEGDIRLVERIPEKLQAAIEAPGITRFVYPQLDGDTSVESLSPAEKERIEEALIAAKGRIETVAVSDVGDLLVNAICDESLVLAGLRQGFFTVTQAPITGQGPIEKAVSFLTEGNEDRFWNQLEASLLAGRGGFVEALLTARVQYQVGESEYPEGLGRKLLHVVLSLPPAVRRLKLRFPLLSLDRCLPLLQHAGPGDHEDAQLFLNAALGKVGYRRQDEEAQPPETGTPGVPPDAASAVDAVLEEISAETLTRTIGLPIDEARGSYVLEQVILESHEAFYDTVSAFYLTLLRHTESLPSSVDARSVASEAIALLDRAFRNKGGSDAALSEARCAAQGGMRLVLDVMTEQFKTEQYAKRVNRVLKESLDPLNWEAQVAFMNALLTRLGPQLPPEVRAQPPARFARRHEAIVRTYVQSMDRVRQLLRSL